MFVGSNSNITVAAGSPYLFNTIYSTNNNISYSSGVFSLKVPGFYKIHFDESAGGTGNITPTLVVNGTASSYALGSATSSGATDLVNIAFDTVVRVVPAVTGYATISVNNAGVAATVTAANIVIERIA